MEKTERVVKYGDAWWTFSVLPGTVHVKAETSGDMMMFSAPTKRGREIEWKLRHTRQPLDDSERMAVASVIETFANLLCKPAAKQRAVMVAIRKGIEAES